MNLIVKVDQHEEAFSPRGLPSVFARSLSEHIAIEYMNISYNIVDTGFASGLLLDFSKGFCVQQTHVMLPLRLYRKAFPTDTKFIVKNFQETAHRQEQGTNLANLGRN